jgi:hypothetical protein
MGDHLSRSLEFTVKGLNIRDTDLISTDGALIYSIRTPWNTDMSCEARTTITRRYLRREATSPATRQLPQELLCDEEVLVAEIEWHWFVQTVIKMGDKSMKRGEFLHGNSWAPCVAH